MPISNTSASYAQATTVTAENLKTIAQSPQLHDLSQLSLPEIDKSVEIVAQMTPAGNVPGMILSGLARLPGRRLPLETIRRDVNLLFKGVANMLDKTVYGTFFAGPAAILWGYQHLLRLAGKDPDSAFPEGVWQFYVDYALREDTARHTNETLGFFSELSRHHITLSRLDLLTSWVMTAVHTLHQYPDLLANEWYERRAIYLLAQLVEQAQGAPIYNQLWSAWLQRRPYARGVDAGPTETYPTYRRRQFLLFWEAACARLPADLLARWQEVIAAAEVAELPSYMQQMSILTYLEPGAYGETRTPIALADTQVGLVERGRYYLIPVCGGDGREPISVDEVRTQIAAILATSPGFATPLTSLARCQRAQWPSLRRQLSAPLLAGLTQLRHAPILINGDACDGRLPLGSLRQAERGVGDHAVTIFQTGQSVAMDQSHILFDGGWGAALAEIMTNEALSWAFYLHSQSPPLLSKTGAPPAPLSLALANADKEIIANTSAVATEVAAETDLIALKPILALRKLFKMRSDLLQLTVNDLLILYRAIHAATYQLAPELARELRELGRQGGPAAAAATLALESIDAANHVNPAILIPVDASAQSPQDRLYPMTFTVPVMELDLLLWHQRSLAKLSDYQHERGDRAAAYNEFDHAQRMLLGALAGFGQVMSRAKEVANRGESASMGAIKLLAHLPMPLQRLLDQIPSRFELLNDILKGGEVFSNVGSVAASSSLSRFITAKDDNEKKSLAWGVITDATGVVRLSLRDFRPYVAALVSAGQSDLAQRLTADYLTSYANGFNQYVRDLQSITRASRETQLFKG